MEKKGLVANIQKFSLHDGPGIRTTVFFKGCPLKCWWCHNPESIMPKREGIFNEKLCINCGSCGGIDSFDLKDATEKQCLDCPTLALSMSGIEYSVDELMKEILTDQVFYEKSKGGVTFSGGEPLWQHEFLGGISKACKAKGIQVTVDTSGFSNWCNIEKLLPYVDLFLYDIKLLDSGLHKKYTGVDNSLILKNLQKLSSKGKRIYLRLPVIPTVNDSEEAIIRLCEFIKDLNIEQVNLLPYHAIGRGKYKNLKLPYLLEVVKEPDATKMNALKDIFESYNLKTIIGG